MKVIFLDFDGVITTYKSQYRLDEEKMKLIEHICNKTDAYIVISSSWRMWTLEDTIKGITDTSKRSVPVPFTPIERVVGVTSRMYSFKGDDKKTHFRVPRGVEIERYLDEHEDIDKYVIFDDDSDMLLEQAPYFVKTNTEIGITEEDVKKAIEILNSDE